MASYLKSDGKTDTMQALSSAQPASATDGSLVATLFVRLLKVPTNASPLLHIYSGTTTYFGIWAGGVQSGASVPAAAAFIGLGVEDTGGGTQRSVRAEADSSGNPVRIGRIYKVQVIMDAASGDAARPFALSIAVDGVIIDTTEHGSNDIDIPGVSDVVNIGGKVGAFGAAVTTRTHAEYFQAMIETDRAITRNVSSPYNITEVDTDTDPFTDLALAGDATASLSHRWLLNDGSGTVATDAEGNSNGTVSSSSLWAPSTLDPAIVGTAGTWTFENVEGYDLRQSDAPDAVPLPVYGPSGPVGDNTSGEVRLAPSARWSTSDAEDLDGWSTTLGLTIDTSTVFAGNGSIEHDQNNNRNHNTSLGRISSGTETEEYWMSWWFYDSGGTSGTILGRTGYFPSTGAPDVDMGLFSSISTTQYVTNIQGATDDGTSGGASQETVAFGTRSTGWHQGAIYVSRTNSPTTVDSTFKFYWDGSLVRNYTGYSTISPLTGLGMRSRGTAANSTNTFYDDFEAGYQKGTSADAEHHGLVESTGTLVFPLLQPSGDVQSFDTVVITDETAGDNTMEIGTNTYEFRHSDDGTAPTGAWSTLNDTNLAALTPGGLGDDIIEVRANFTSGMEDMSSAALRSIVINWTYSASAKVYYTGGIANAKRLTRGMGF